MKDVLITDDNDIELIDGDLAVVDGRERIKQHVKTAIFTLPLSWLLDYRVGVDIINGLKAYPRVLVAQIKQAILQCYGVDNLLKFKTDLSTENYKISGAIISGNDEVAVNTNIALE